MVSATENISDGPEWIILESMLEGMAEYYSAELAQKINLAALRKMRWRAKTMAAGFHLAISWPMTSISELTAPIVREIFERYAAGESLRNITQSLNARHISTARKKKFGYNSFHTLLKNRKYIGEYHYADVVVPDAVPAIVSKDLFDRVQTRMKKNRRLQPGLRHLKNICWQLNCFAVIVNAWW